MKFNYKTESDNYDIISYYDKRNSDYIFMILLCYYLAFISLVLATITWSPTCPLWFKMEMLIGCFYFLFLLRTKPLMSAQYIHFTLYSVPKVLKDNAKSLYPRTWRSCAIECFEAHVYGDCPICGAV